MVGLTISILICLLMSLVTGGLIVCMGVDCIRARRMKDTAGSIILFVPMFMFFMYGTLHFISKL